MKKNILLLLFIFLLTGCTIDYNLEIEKNRLVENISGTVSKEEYELNEEYADANKIYNLLFTDQTPILNGTDVYDKNIENTSDGVKYNFGYIYKNNYDKSRIINTCFEKVDIREEDDYYYVDLSGDFYCLYTNKINVNVKSNYVVIEHNADKVKDNTYTWIIDKNNKEIHAVISKDLVNNISTESKPNYFRIIGFVVLIVLSVITYFLYKKKNSGEV